MSDERDGSPASVVVEAETLPDGRAIRFFSWAPHRERHATGPDRGAGDPPRDTHGPAGAR